MNAPISAAAAPNPDVALVTGTSSGFGRVIAAALNERGYRVYGTSRSSRGAPPPGVRPLMMNVDDAASVESAIAELIADAGRIDVLINNAGFGIAGAIEDTSDQEARAQIETNLFGALWVTQAALPFLRAQGSGHIIQVSSIGGISAFPNVGLYHASKWGLEGFSQALSQEVKPFGISVTLIEPGGFSTDWGGSSSVHSAPNPGYDEVRGAFAEARKARVSTPGDPAASAAAILKIVDAEDKPLRVFFGTAPLGIAKADYAGRLETWEKWNDVSVLAQG